MGCILIPPINEDLHGKRSTVRISSGHSHQRPYQNFAFSSRQCVFSLFLSFFLGRPPNFALNENLGVEIAPRDLLGHIIPTNQARGPKLENVPLWARSTKSPDESTGLLAYPSLRWLAPLTRLLAPPCLLCSLLCLLAHFTHSRAHGTVND